MSENMCSEVFNKYKDLLCHEPEVNTSKLYETTNIPARFECPHMFTGYGSQDEKSNNPFYRTANSDYGFYTPNPHTVPHRYFPRSQTFSNHLAKCGMYRNYSLNTVMDKN